MKKRIKERPIGDNCKCCVCGIEYKVIKLLWKYGVKHQSNMDLEESADGYICSECKTAIQDHIWKDVIANRKNNWFGIAYSVKKAIDEFVRANLSDFKEIAEEYRHITRVASNFDSMIDNLAFKTLKSSTKLSPDCDNPCVPLYSDVSNLLLELKHDRIKLDGCRWNDKVDIDTDILITEENAKDILVDEKAAEVVSAIGDVRFIEVVVEPETFYEDSVEIYFKFIALDKSSIQEQKQIAKSVIKPKKKNSSSPDDIFGNNTELGGFKID